MIADSNEAVSTMNEVKQIMDEQNKNIHGIEKQFDRLYEQIDMSMGGVGNIADKTQKLDDSRINVVDIVQNLTAIAQENAASTEETFASMIEISSIIADISTEADELKQIASEIDTSMEIFEL